MKTLFKRGFIGLMALLLVALTLLPTAAVQPTHTVSAAYLAGPYYQNLTALTLTGDQRTDLILVALSQLGYHEGDSDNELHGLNTSGSRNFVEYNRLHGKVDNGEGNGVSYGYYWCCSFATWCARQAGISREVVPNEISCWRLIDNHFKPMGVYHPVSEGYRPVAGDYVFFRGDDALPGAPSDHIGIVLYVQGQTLYTVEGNSIYQSVATRSYSLSDPYIVGYASPNYTEKADAKMDFNPATGGYHLRDANYYITATYLNVRAGSGAADAIIGQLTLGDTVVLLEVVGNRGRIRYGERDGWISLSYAQYVPTPVTDAPPSATLYLEAGSEIWDSVTVDRGGSLTLPALPDRASTSPATHVWTPQGWDSDGDSHADLFPGQTLTLTKDMTLSAVYLREPTPYTIRFYGADGLLIEEQTCPYGTVPTPPDMSLHAPEDGRIFDGWDSVILAVMEDMDYHAVYTDPPAVYRVRFLYKDGRVLSEQLLHEGEMPVRPDDQLSLIEDGSIFLGWDAELVPATADVDYHPVYEQRLSNEPDEPDPPQEQPPTPAERPSVTVMILIFGGVLLLIGALLLAWRSTHRSAR